MSLTTTFMIPVHQDWTYDVFEHNGKHVVNRACKDGAKGSIVQFVGSYNTRSAARAGTIADWVYVCGINKYGVLARRGGVALIKEAFGNMKVTSSEHERTGSTTTMPPDHVEFALTVNLRAYITLGVGQGEELSLDLVCQHLRDLITSGDLAMDGILGSATITEVACGTTRIKTNLNMREVTL